MFLERLSWIRRRLLLDGAKQTVKVAADPGHGRVVGANGCLADRQRPLILRPGASQVPKVPQHVAKVAAPDGYVRVVGAKGRLANRQCPFQLRLSALQVAKLPQHEAEGIAVGGHSGRSRRST
jgi:hypothetical protein